MAKASSPQPRPNLLYLDVQMKGISVSCLDNKGVTHSFMSLKLPRELGFANT